jgi:rhodanese-related sulfurtransferase
MRALLVAFLFVACPARADGPELSAPDALAAAEAGKLTIVDIRTPEEWRETGVAKGVKRLDMRDPAFEAKLLDLVGGDRAAPIGLICRTGSRTTVVQRYLLRRGYANVYNIREGMIGSRAGPGWLTRGLPVEACRAC